MATTNDIDVIAEDAPTPGDVSTDDTVTARYEADDGRTLIAVDHDGDRYCIECAAEAYIERCLDNPRAIPYGGPVSEGSEVDCPGIGCGHCLRQIEGQTLLHYDAVCGEHCPKGYGPDLDHE